MEFSSGSRSSARASIQSGAPGPVPAERFGPTGFYCGHHLELGQADMPCIGPPPRGTMGTEYISNLQPRAGHPNTLSLQALLDCLILQLRRHLVGADRVRDRLGGDMCVLGRRAQLGMAEQRLDAEV